MVRRKATTLHHQIERAGYEPGKQYDTGSHVHEMMATLTAIRATEDSAELSGLLSRQDVFKARTVERELAVPQVAKAVNDMHAAVRDIAGKDL
jgi:hypothetical protein